jgi:hypothetical protein
MTSAVDDILIGVAENAASFVLFARADDVCEGVVKFCMDGVIVFVAVGDGLLQRLSEADRFEQASDR